MSVYVTMSSWMFCMEAVFLYFENYKGFSVVPLCVMKYVRLKFLTLLGHGLELGT
jgi:hypothetical protein